MANVITKAVTWLVGGREEKKTQSRSVRNHSYKKSSISDIDAISQTVVYACVNFISEQLSKVDFYVVEKTKDSFEPTEDEKLPLNYFKNNIINPYNNKWRDFLRAYAYQLKMYGNVVYIRDAHILFILNIKDLKFYISSTTGEIVYLYKARDGKEILFLASDVIHDKSMTSDGLLGMPPFPTGFTAFKNLNNANDKANSYVDNGANLGGVIEIENELSDEAYKRLETSTNKYESMSDDGKTMLLEGGAKFKQMDLKAIEDSYTNYMAKNEKSIASAFGIELSLLGLEASKDVEQTMRLFQERTLEPIVLSLCDSLNMFFFDGSQKGKYKIKYNIQDLDSIPYKNQAEYISKMVMNGIITINEGRKLLGKPPVKGGDVHYIQKNLAEINSNNNK